MHLPRAACAVVALLLSCVTASGTSPEAAAGDLVPVNAIAQATTHRVMTELAAQTPPSFGSFRRRVWAPEFDRLIAPVRSGPLGSALPIGLSGPTVASWETKLNDGWKTVDPEVVRGMTEEVLAAAAPARDGLAALLSANGASLDGTSQLAARQVLGILDELVMEVGLLGLRDSGSTTAYEEFVSRYPDGPYAGSVLFALGALFEDRREFAEARSAFTRMLQKAPAHPLAENARQRLAGL